MTTPQTTRSEIKTSKASMYLDRMCRHFAHKVEVERSESEACIKFSIGRCQLVAQSSCLLVTCFSPDPNQLAELKDVVKSHFDRFAQKDSLILHW